MRHGFSLAELLLVLALGGLLLGITVPMLSGALDRIEVHAAANHLAAAHQLARMMAVTHGKVLELSVNQEELVIRRRGQTTWLWSQPGPGANRVSLSGGTRRFTFSPEGLSLGLSNATMRLARGSATRTVIVSRLGRVRITR